MKSNSLATTLLLAVSLMLAPVLAGVVAAQDIEMPTSGVVEEVPETRGIYEVGLGVGIAPEYEGSRDNDIYPLPYVSLRFENHMTFEWVANTLRANLIPSPTWKAGFMGQYIQERDHTDNRKVDNLENVEAAFMLGGFLGIEIKRFTASIEAMKDVAEGNDGSIVRLRAGYTFPVAHRLILSVNGYTTWADNDYMASYFGVDPEDSRRSGITEFDADAGFKDFGITVPIRYNATDHWSVMGVGGYKRLIGDAADSPIVDDLGDENQLFGGAFLIYRF